MCTVPVIVTVAPIATPSIEVTVMSLVPLVASPLPSCRWIQFRPITPSLYLTTTARMVTVFPFNCSRWAHASATVRASAPRAFSTLSTTTAGVVAAPMAPAAGVVP